MGSNSSLQEVKVLDLKEKLFTVFCFFFRSSVEHLCQAWAFVSFLVNVCVVKVVRDSECVKCGWRFEIGSNLRVQENRCRAHQKWSLRSAFWGLRGYSGVHHRSEFLRFVEFLMFFYVFSFILKESRSSLKHFCEWTSVVWTSLMKAKEVDVKDMTVDCKDEPV